MIQKQCKKFLIKCFSDVCQCLFIFCLWYISAIKDNLRSADFQEGGNNMSSNEFVTQKDLDNLEEKIDLKMENIQAKMDAEFRSINSKIDNLPTIFENMLLKNEKEQEIKRKETNRYIWGTLILGTIGVVISVASLFF